jgi:hypothetical protein
MDLERVPCVSLHSLPLSTGCRVSSRNPRGSQCTCVPFSNQKGVTQHYSTYDLRTYYNVMSTYVRTYVRTGTDVRTEVQCEHGMSELSDWKKYVHTYYTYVHVYVTTF